MQLQRWTGISTNKQWSIRERSTRKTLLCCYQNTDNTSSAAKVSQGVPRAFPKHRKQSTRVGKFVIRAASFQQEGNKEIRIQRNSDQVN